VGTVSLVLDLHSAHERWVSSTDPTLNGNLHYPNDLDKPLNETTVDKIRKYFTDYNQDPPNTISFMPAIVSTSGRLHSEFVRILFLQVHGETERFFAASGVQLAQLNRGGFHYHNVVLSSLIKNKTGSILVKASVPRFILNIDGSTIISTSHTHPSHLQTSRLLTSS
jgi:hypothetical protein